MRDVYNLQVYIDLPILSPWLWQYTRVSFKGKSHGGICPPLEKFDLPPLKSVDLLVWQKENQYAWYINLNLSLKDKSIKAYSTTYKYLNRTFSRLLLSYFNNAFRVIVCNLRWCLDDDFHQIWRLFSPIRLLSLVFISFICEMLHSTEALETGILKQSLKRGFRLRNIWGNRQKWHAYYHVPNMVVSMSFLAYSLSWAFMPSSVFFLIQNSKNAGKWNFHSK